MIQSRSKFRISTLQQFYRYKTTKQNNADASNYKHDNYQYLHKSELATSLFQPSLPSLPVPKLEESIGKYLNAVKPILSTSEYEYTQKLAQEFIKSDGIELQKILENFNKDNKHTNYISDMWFHMYLSDRASLPLNYNPVIIFKDEPKPTTQLNRATNLIISSLRFRRSLKENVLYPEVFFLDNSVKDKSLYKNTVKFLPKNIKTYASYVFKAYPLDISQYSRLFQTSRIPRISKDEIYNSTKDIKHLVALRHGIFYKVDVLDKTGDILPAHIIQTSINHILQAQTKENTPISVFSSANRDYWAKLRQSLLEAGNADALNVIDNALFIVCLDDENIHDQISMIKNFLYTNAENRWFDKSFSLIVNRDAKAGVNFEHSWGDGVAVLRYFQEVHKDSIEQPQVVGDFQSKNLDVSEYVKPIDIKLNEGLKDEIIKCAGDHNAISDSVDINVMEYETFGRSLCKKHGVSPDFIMQVAFQLAYYKLTGEFEAVYESCSTAAFRHGRTETVRPLTSDTRDFCVAVESSNKGMKNIATSDLYQLIQNCSKNHNELTKNAAMGKGFDRHLFALKNMAERNNLKTSELFKDMAYSKINSNILSTSTLNSEAVLAGGFGPVNKKGFGIGYSIMPNYLGTVVSNYKENTSGKDFSNCLRSAFEDIYNVLTSIKK